MYVCVWLIIIIMHYYVFYIDIYIITENFITNIWMGTACAQTTPSGIVCLYYIVVIKRVHMSAA